MNIREEDVTLLQTISAAELLNLVRENKQSAPAELQMKVLKKMMSKLHPDVESGDIELFKTVSNIYETIKRDAVRQESL